MAENKKERENKMSENKESFQTYDCLLTETSVEKLG